MKRYIDADALKPDYIRPSLSNSTVYTYYVSLFQIQNAPTADVVEVVRCKDCLYGKPLGVVGTWCNRNDGLYPNAGYCSYGERREDAKIH